MATVTFLVSSSASNLNAALAEFASTVTVEAEYGNVTVKGTVATLAHHGMNAGNLCPCSYKNGFVNEIEAVGLSHIDLDALGGCAAVLGNKPEVESFWKLAEFIDLNGPHKLSKAGASLGDTAMLYAWWAWSKKNRLQVPQDGSVADATQYVSEAVDVLTRILASDDTLLAAGEEFKKEEATLNANSFIEIKDGVILRTARGNEFVNALYASPSGEIAKAIVTRKGDGGCTISFADPIPGVSAVKLAQEIWGEEAGGRDVIAGNPRGQRAEMADILRLRDAVIAAIATK